MPLTLSTVLDQEDLHLELIAGHQGLDTRGYIGWVHATELPNPGPWLQDHTVLLTTGFGIYKSVSLQRKLMKHLDEHQAVGIGIGLGDWLSEVPNVILEEADTRSIPVFLVPYSIPFSFVTRRVAELLLRHDNANSENSLKTYRRLLALVISGHDPTMIINNLADAHSDCMWILFNYFGQVEASKGPKLMEEQELWSRIRTKNHRGRIFLREDNYSIMGTGVSTDNEVEGFLVLVSNRSLTNADEETFELLQKGLQLALLRNQSPRHKRRQETSDLFFSLLTYHTSAQALAQRIQATSLPEIGEYYIVAISSTNLSANNLCGVAEDVLMALGEDSLCGIVADFVLAVARDPDAFVSRLHKQINVRSENNLKIGTSRQRTYFSDLAISIREAMLACKAAPSGVLTDVRTMGAWGLVPQLIQSSTAQSYLDQVLGPVIRADERDGSNLVATLRTYIRLGTRPSPVAAELGIHRHTLTYRLERIADLTGHDPRRPHGLIDLGFAIFIFDIEVTQERSD